MSFIWDLPDYSIFILLCVFSISISLCALFLVRRYVPLDFRYRDNPVLGNISALISIIYGVLVGLTALYLINNIGFIADAIQDEANAAANIYRDSKWLKEPAQQKIQQSLKQYLTGVIQEEWPQMKKGKTPEQSDSTKIDTIAEDLMHYKVVSTSDSLIVTDLLEEIKALYNARETRIQMTYSALNTQIWLVILIGTALTLMINYLFGMHFYLHVLSVCVVALMSSSMIFLLVTLDRPFQGDFVVEPDAFRYVLQRIEGEMPQVTQQGVQQAPVTR